MTSNHLFLSCFIILFRLTAFSQSPAAIDLPAAFKKGNISVVNRELTLLNETAHQGISLSKDFGEGVAWLKNIEFSNGVLEFDVRGEDVKQHSFVGIAFHGKNDSTYDAIYLRPFQFKAEEEVLRNRSIQYISLPDYTWRKLREKSPGIYEHSIQPAPDPNSWVRVRIVVENPVISVYINGNNKPELVVKKVTGTTSGSVGFYVADTSGGDFANLTITKTD